MKLTKAVFALLLLRPVAAAATDPADYVCPLMGSMSTFDLSAGNTYPAIARPWGMNFWTPQTGKMGDGWQYTYSDKRIRGFKQTHQPSPWINDYGQFSLMPVTGTPVFDQDSRASWFSHKAETVTPYYYKVYLADHDVVAEMTPTDRAAVMRFTFPEGESFVVVDAFDHRSEVCISGRRVTGRSTRNSGGVPDNFANYFVVEFDRDPDYVATADGKELHPDSLAYAGEHAGAVIGFRTKRGEQVTARVASSFISQEQAIVNLGEVAGVDFDSVCAAGRDAWNDVLGRVEIDPEGADPDQLRTFYTCLYRSTLFPRKFYEMDAAGNPVHYSPYNGRVMPGYLYTDTGVWDTFRALFPLLNLLYPSVSLEMQEGFLNAYRESGFFPEWCSPGHRDCMVGNNSASVLADAWIKGIRVSDPATLWEGVVHGTNAEHPTVRSTGRLGFDYYNRLGYVPCDVGINESVARTLEYAYDDWCIYRLGLTLGRPAGELEPYARRAGNYRNVFLPSASLMCGRRADGSFALPFSPLKWGGDFTEGNSWHYTWSVFHDPDGLAALMGGPDRMDAMLDSVFAIPPLYDDSYYGFPIHEIREMTVMNMGNYAHGNQPIQHMIYLYDTVGRPWKAQRRVRQVMDALYSPAPDGYCGDEDNGQTSAWYVFSALGFYPLTPGSLSYAVGSPLFRRATLTFEDGRRLAIEAPGNSPSAVYIRSASLNGRSLGGNFLDHNAITSGGTLRFEMSDTPDTQSKTLK